MRYFEMPTRWVADDTQNASVNFTNPGRKAKPNTLDAAFGRGKQLPPGSIALALSGVGGRGVCSNAENAHPCEIGQLGIARKMTSAVFAWHYSKLLRVRASGSIITERSNTKSIVGL